jgi:hypothetical protein
MTQVLFFIVRYAFNLFFFHMVGIEKKIAAVQIFIKYNSMKRINIFSRSSKASTVKFYLDLKKYVPSSCSMP